MQAVNRIHGELFLPSHINLLDQAVTVSEDIVSDYFRLTTDYWLKNPYEINTLKHAEPTEIPRDAYAHLMKFAKPLCKKDSGADDSCMYRITIYDNRVLAVTGGIERVLWPFFVYILAHELIHIARFARFECTADEENKRAEEEKVHDLTNEILTNAPVSGLKTVVDFFTGEQVQGLLT